MEGQAKTAFKRGFQSGLWSGFGGALFLAYIFRWLTRSKSSSDSKQLTERAAHSYQSLHWPLRCVLVSAQAH
jgi:hypothetical protein